MDSPLLRPYSAADETQVLALNEASVAVLSPMDAERFALLRDRCALLRVAEEDGRVAGFLMGFRPGTDYDSANYRWFSGQYDDFLYIDRVVVSNDFRGRGIASLFYDHAIDWARGQGIEAMVAEIDIEPPNQASLKFHERFGFREVDRLTHSATKVVSLQHRALD